MNPACKLLIPFALAMAGCGSGSGVPESLPDQYADGDVPITGRATKGPISQASVSLFAVDGRGNADGGAIATTQTDAAGNWSFSLPADHPPYLIAVSGGRFVDESDANTDSPRVIELGSGDTLLSVLLAGEQTAAVTLFTHALVEKSRREAGGGDFLALVGANRTQFRDALGVDPLLTRSADPLAPAGSDAERRYGLLAGGAAYALNSLAISRGIAAADFDTIELFSRDLVDCAFDGRGIGGQRLYDFAALGGRTLNDDILRFRNNHFDAYLGVAIPRLPQVGCTVTPGTRDSVPPVFTVLAGPLIVAAENAAGVAGSAPPITAALAQFAASDDRDQTPKIEARLPARIALGRNEFAVTATDEWGNRAEVIWLIEVRDLAPPFITPPGDLTVAASGELTPVELGAPLFGDNVSDLAALVVANDAPANGFPPGSHVVTWTATDEAGLVASAEQRVYVSGGPPLQLQSLPSQFATESAAFVYDLAGSFVDPVLAPLSFSLTGLPSGTGLTLDAGTGLVSGAPSAADLAAQPLALTVTVSNGPFESVAPWSIAIQPAIPAFVLSTTSLSLTEDFSGDVAIEAIPLGASVAGGSVTFAVEQVSGEQELVSLIVDAPSGRVVLASRPDRFGGAQYRIRASNSQNGASFEDQFSVEISPVNDAPQALLSGDAATAVADEFFELPLGMRFADVDDVTLSFAASGAPLGFTTGAGVLSGVANEVAAAGGVYRVSIVATDATGASASSFIDIDVDIRDSDGDGLSDAREAQQGTDAANPDSDADGVDDGAELAAGADPLLPASSVIYLSTAGSDDNGGTSFVDALRSHAGIASVMPGASAAQPAFILYAADATDVYGGTLRIVPPCDHIVLLGSVDAANGVTRLATSGSPSSRLSADSDTPVTVTGCTDVRLVNLAVADNKATGLRVSDSTVNMHNVHISGNFSELPGGGLAVDNGSVVFSAGAISANETREDGAGVSITGDGANVVIRNSLVSGNYAAGDGGALHLDAPNGRLEVFNSLLTGNSALRGGALYASSGFLASVASSTFSFNQIRGAGAGAAVDHAASVTMSLSDSLVWFNRDAQLNNSPLPAGVESTFNTLDQPSPGTSDLQFSASGPAFGPGYTLTAGSLALDLGSVPAAVAGLDTRFAASGSPYPDAGVLDRGYHYPAALSATPLLAEQLDAGFRVSRGPSVAFASFRRLTFAPRSDGRPLGPGRRVSIAPLGNRSILAGAVNVFGAEPDVLASDLGNGDYQVWIDARYSSHDWFRLTVDGVAFTLRDRRQCVVAGCGEGDPAVEESSPSPRRD